VFWGGGGEYLLSISSLVMRPRSYRVNRLKAAFSEDPTFSNAVTRRSNSPEFNFLVIALSRTNTSNICVWVKISRY